MTELRKFDFGELIEGKNDENRAPTATSWTTTRSAYVAEVEEMGEPGLKKKLEQTALWNLAALMV